MHRGLASAATWVGIPLVAAAALLPGLRAGPSLDAAVFGLIGRQVAKGAVPYLDTWDHKPPGVHLVHAVADGLPLLDQWVWVWLLTVAAICATSWMLVTVLRRVVAPSAAVGAGLCCALGLGHFVLSLGGGMSESFAVLPATAAFLLVAGGRSAALWSAIAGSLVGVAMVVSPQLAPAGLAVLVLVMRSGVSAVLALAVGAMLPVGVLLTWLGGIGALPALAEALFEYGVAYRDSVGPGFGTLPWVVLALMLLLAPALAGIVTLRRAPAAIRRIGFASLVWVATAVLLVALQGRLYGHYAIGVVPPMTVLAAIGAADLFSRLPSGALRLATGGIGATLLVLSLVVGAAGARMELAMIEAVNSRAEALAAWVEDHGAAGGSMLVWGNAPQVYLSTDTTPAGRYGFLYPLTTYGYGSERRVQDELRRLEASPPAIVVDAGSSAPGAPGFLPLLIDRPLATDGRDLDLLDPLRAFVADAYELADIVEGWPVYRRSEPGG